MNWASNYFCWLSDCIWAHVPQGILVWTLINNQTKNWYINEIIMAVVKVSQPNKYSSKHNRIVCAILIQVCVHVHIFNATLNMLSYN